MLVVFSMDKRLSLNPAQPINSPVLLVGVLSILVARPWISAARVVVIVAELKGVAAERQTGLSLHLLPAICRPFIDRRKQWHWTEGVAQQA